jgi:PleD family two-component response regulator
MRATEAQSSLALVGASISLGVVTFDPAQNNSADLAALMRAADEALYDAKRGGGNRVRTNQTSRLEGRSVMS